MITNALFNGDAQYTTSGSTIALGRLHRIHTLLPTAAIDATLPATANLPNGWHVIVLNTSGSFAVTVKDALSATVDTLTTNDGGTFIWSGTQWLSHVRPYNTPLAVASSTRGAVGTETGVVAQTSNPSCLSPYGYNYRLEDCDNPGTYRYTVDDLGDYINKIVIISEVADTCWTVTVQTTIGLHQAATVTASYDTCALCQATIPSEDCPDCATNCYTAASVTFTYNATMNGNQIFCSELEAEGDSGNDLVKVADDANYKCRYAYTAAAPGAHELSCRKSDSKWVYRYSDEFCNIADYVMTVTCVGGKPVGSFTTTLRDGGAGNINCGTLAVVCS